MVKAKIKGISIVCYTENEYRNGNAETDLICGSGEYADLLSRCPVPNPFDKLERHEPSKNSEMDDYSVARMKWLAEEVGDENPAIERIDNPDDYSWMDNFIF